eukprot:3409245-Pleurochrysis_carterae.AAC.1
MSRWRVCFRFRGRSGVRLPSWHTPCATQHTRATTGIALHQRSGVDAGRAFAALDRAEPVALDLQRRDRRRPCQKRRPPPRSRGERQPDARCARASFRARSGTQKCEEVGVRMHAAGGVKQGRARQSRLRRREENALGATDARACALRGTELCRKERRQTRKRQKREQEGIGRLSPASLGRALRGRARRLAPDPPL